MSSIFAQADKAHSEEMAQKLDSLNSEIKEAQAGWQTAQSEVEAQTGKLEQALEQLQQAQQQLSQEEAEKATSVLVSTYRAVYAVWQSP